MTETAYPGRRSRSAFGRSPILRLAVLVGVIYWALAILYFVVDPFSLYPWGIRQHLLSIDYPPRHARYLVDIVAKDPAIDTVLVGGSTSRDFSRGMMRAILGAPDPFNLSYGGSRPGDRALVTGQLLRYSHAKRVILAFDFDYALKETAFQEGFPVFLYDDNPINDLRMADYMGLATALSRLRHHGVVATGASTSRSRRNAAHAGFQSRGQRDRLAQTAIQYRASIDRPSGRRCEDFSALQHQLLPYARALSKKGVELDIFIPPYSMFAYYEFAGIAEFGTSALNDQLRMRRCLVAEVEGMKGVQVFGFDNDAWITGDLANYKDASHTGNPKVQAFILQAIKDRTHRLTIQNIDDYLSTLHHRILNPTLYDSRAKAFAHD